MKIKTEQIQKGHLLEYLFYYTDILNESLETKNYLILLHKMAISRIEECVAILIYFDFGYVFGDEST